MGKANKATGAAVKAVKAVKAPAVATPLPVQQGGNWQGYSLCALYRALGYAGYTAKQGAAFAAAVGYTVQGSTAGCQVGAGRQYAAGVPQPHHKGTFAPLTPELLAHVTAAVGTPSKPHTGTVAPVPPATPRAPKAPTAPLVTLVGRGKCAGQTVQVTPEVAAVLQAGGKAAQWAVQQPAPVPAS